MSLPQTVSLNEQGYEQLTLFQADFPASPIVLPGSGLARQMTARSGQKCLELSKNCGLLGFLEKMLLDSSAWASTARYLTWKPKVTNQGRLYFQLVPQAPRMSESEFSLWATPSAADSVGSHSGGQGKSLRTDIANGKKSLLPTPTANDAKNATLPASQWNRNSIVGAVMRGMWPTPKAGGNRNSRNAIIGTNTNGAHKSDMGLEQAVEAMYGILPRELQSPKELPARFREIFPKTELNAAVGGRLNPEWVEWLMGFPAGWTDLSA